MGRFGSLDEVEVDGWRALRHLGNFRLVQRLFAQIERVVAINNLPAVTTEMITLARERLVDGPI